MLPFEIEDHDIYLYFKAIRANGGKREIFKKWTLFFFWRIQRFYFGKKGRYFIFIELCFIKTSKRFLLPFTTISGEIINLMSSKLLINQEVSRLIDQKSLIAQLTFFFKNN